MYSFYEIFPDRGGLGGFFLGGGGGGGVDFWMNWDFFFGGGGGWGKGRWFFLYPS